MRPGYVLAAGALLALVMAGGEAWAHGMTTGTGLPSGAQFSGGIQCAKLTDGKVSFRPALTTTGDGKETATVTGHVSGCTGNISQDGLTIASGSLKVHYRLRDSNCAALQGAVRRNPATTVTWTDTAGSSSAIQPTELTFDGTYAQADLNGRYIISLPGNDRGNSQEGSFPALAGLGFAMTATQTQTQLANQCATSGGLAAATIAPASVNTYSPRACPQHGQWWLCITPP
jgi:hypothetical protein